MNVIKLRKDAEVPKDELDRQAVGTAIVILHGEGRYYEALDILCRVVGWPPLVRGFSTPEERDKWLAEQAGKLRGTSAPAPKIVTETPPGKLIKCETCRRFYDPHKVFKRKSINVCGECGRRFNQNGKGKTR
jgi:hypothetical protein